MRGQCSPLELLTVWGALGSVGFARAFWGSASTSTQQHQHQPRIHHLRRQDNSSSTTSTSDIPTAENFIRRACFTAAVLDDYLYLDGGQITESVDGSSPADSPSYAVTSTWSIDLTKPWTNSTVEFRSIPKEGPNLGKQVHWVDQSTKSIYTWGGFVTDGAAPPRHQLWVFQADGSGGGNWSSVAQQDYFDFQKLLNPVGAAYSQSGTTGYAFGGSVTSTSDTSVQDVGLPGLALPGLVSYDFLTGQWNNASTSYYGGYGTNLNGRAEYVPFGPNGLLVILGGSETPIDATNDTIVQENWNSITLVDPVTGESYTQTTTGTKPPTIESHCTVGVPGPNGSFEIYIYGGVSDQLRTTSGQMTVLSLPAFTFFQGPSTVPRSDHQCAIIGKGQRQMLSYGGVDGENRTFAAPATADPWTNGIGVFDMVDLQWTAGYDPNATAYDTPAVVRAWYDAGNLQKIHWDDPALSQLMLNVTTSPTNGTNMSTGAKDAQSRGAIAGGVAGSIAGVAALVAVALYYRRRRRRSQDGSAIARRGISDPFGARIQRGFNKRSNNRHNNNNPYDSAAAGFYNTESIQDKIADYRPEPWPKDPNNRSLKSPDSSMFSSQTLKVDDAGFLTDGCGGAPAAAYMPRRSELPGDHCLPEELMGSGPAQPEELMGDSRAAFAHELPAPLASPRLELPDQIYPR